MTKLDVIVRAPFHGVSGYAYCSRNILNSLLKTGLKVGIKDYSFRESNVVSYDKEFFDSLRADQYTKSRVVIHVCTPNSVVFVRNAINIVYTMFELNKIPNLDDYKNNTYLGWVQMLNQADLVVVPTNHSKEIFINSGVRTPIEVIPIPLDVSLAQPMELKTNNLNMLSVFQWIPRKGPTDLLTAAFLANTDSTLYIKTYLQKVDKAEPHIIETIKAVKESFHYKVKTGIVPVISNYSDKDMNRLYASCDVYISATRGEGFCLPLIQALLQEKPAIVPIHTSIKDLIPEDQPFIFPVKYRIDFATDMWRSSYICPSMKWFVIDKQSMADQIKVVRKLKDEFVLHKGEKISKLSYFGEQGRKYIIEKVNYNRVAKTWKNLLTKLISGKR